MILWQVNYKYLNKFIKILFFYKDLKNLKITGKSTKDNNKKAP